MSEKKKELNEIKNLRSKPKKTLRVTSASLESIIYKPFKVLDHGFIRVIDYMGDDSAIVQSARVSYGEGTKKVSNDSGLIRYLMKNWHTTPFEMCEIKLHIKLPIFIARQWIRHRTANVNEYSARYSILDKEFYIPKAQNMSSQSKTNKQGREGSLSKKDTKKFLEILKDDAERNYKHYEDMLNEKQNGEIKNENKKGLSRELARINLTLNTYTQWYWKIDLHNLLHFLYLREDTHAQYEIQAYAEIILNKIVKRWVPHTYNAFKEFQLESFNLSRTATEIIKQRLKGKKISYEKSGLNKREWNELTRRFGIK
ncbi:MAG: Thymidylate synthase ThyX [Alphaproteobacteria bacterium MarineAlpha6_Bin4]|nr:MAG: Thymidylate synthase ThyX [Alphaproteobacteria bacterium MarineAlpha6_Bin3]PPR38475.1 MAG: Thymidylate synthase ThyX [Alphaproteobacteria bacterium MarineAlpha6_Bin4]|tara:strand:- start:9082 stop:10020 length:939 start_codon:yes stop_codon:yes gene_type:complete